MPSEFDDHRRRAAAFGEEVFDDVQNHDVTVFQCAKLDRTSPAAVHGIWRRDAANIGPPWKLLSAPRVGGMHPKSEPPTFSGRNRVRPDEILESP
jgi:hypothetical protein